VNKNKVDQAALRAKIFQLHDRGTPSVKIAEKLYISTTTVAAYLAHRTRGTYKET